MLGCMKEKLFRDAFSRCSFFREEKKIMKRRELLLLLLHLLSLSLSFFFASLFFALYSENALGLIYSLKREMCGIDDEDAK